MKNLIVVVFLMACACGREGPSEQPATTPKNGTSAIKDKTPGTSRTPGAATTSMKASPTVTNSTFDWTLNRAGETLRIDYKGMNASADAIYVVDKLVGSRSSDDFYTTDKAIVMNYMEPGIKGVAKVVLGPEGSDMDTTVVHSPTYRQVAAGAAFTGTVTIPFPLKAYHPLGGAEKIDASVSKIMFRLYYFRGEPGEWTTNPSKTQEPFKVPEGVDVRVFQTAPKTIP